jgi:hypothetical protein
MIYDNFQDFNNFIEKEYIEYKIKKLDEEFEKDLSNYKKESLEIINNLYV